MFRTTPHIPTQSPTSAHMVGARATQVWIALVSVVVTALAFGAGCAAESASTDNGSDSQPNTNLVLGAETKIFAGTTDNDAKGASNVVALKVGAEGDYQLCSGALIAPNVVLTARHCVAKSLTKTVSCDENGLSTNGKHVSGNLPADHVSVYTGSAPQFDQPSEAKATAIISNLSDTLCDEDIALVVLDTEIADVEPFAVRIGAKAPVVNGETVKSIGYGQNDKKMALGTRFRKDNVAVLAMGRGVSKSQTALGPHEFEVGKSICEGDSGGPAVSEETGAIIGVVSRGGNCNDDFGHIYTSTSSFSDLFAQAFAIAGGAPIVEEGQPEGTQTAAHPVAVREPVVTLETPAQPATGGCSSTSAPVSGGGAFGLALGVALVLRRRRR